MMFISISISIDGLLQRWYLTLARYLYFITTMLIICNKYYINYDNRCYNNVGK